MTRKERMIAANPRCCFCGGNAPSENVDHYPPKILFDNKDRPKGFEFASCKACNDSSRNTDLVLSLFSLMSHPDYIRQPNKLEKICKGVQKYCPRSWNELVASMSGAFAINLDLNAIQIGKNTTNHIKYFVRKMICATHYHNSKDILSLATPVFVIIQTEFDRLSGKFPFSEIDLGEYRTLTQGRKNKGSEFRLRYAYNEELGCGIIEIHLHNQFYIHGCYYTKEDLLDEHEMNSKHKVCALSSILPPSENSNLEFAIR